MYSLKTDVYKCVTRCAIAVVKLKIYTISVRMYTLCRPHIRISDRVLPKCGTQDPRDSGLQLGTQDWGLGNFQIFKSLRAEIIGVDASNMLRLF